MQYTIYEQAYGNSDESLGFMKMCIWLFLKN